MTFKDWWKSKPYWLKGGIIGVIFIFLDLLLGFGVNDAFLVPLKIFYLITSSIYPYQALASILPLNYQENTIQRVLREQFLTFATLFYILLGAFIGWIVGKIKSK